MVLQKQTQIGLTFGQIIAIIGIIGGLITSYTDLNSRIAKMEENNQAQDVRIEKVDKMQEQWRVENREDHLRMESKMDLIINKVTQ